MGPPSKKTKKSEAARVQEALDNGRNPLSEEEMHFICCQVMKIVGKEKIEYISATAVWEGSGKIAGTIAAIKKFMWTLGSEAEACRRDSPASVQTMQNKDNLDTLSRNL